MSSSISLTHAVTSGDESALTALLANGADVNESTSGGQTVLILAVILGHTKLVQLLVNAGADPEARDNLGLNAIDWAQRRGLTEALEILNGASHSVVIPQRTDEPKRLINYTPAEPESKDTVSSEEKSRRWIVGLKQRLDEQELRRQNRNETRPAPQPEPLAVEEELPAPPLAAKQNESSVAKEAEIVEAPTTPIQAKAPSASGNRKRCPKCNAIYNSDLISYCAHHIVRLVDLDTPIISEPPKGNPPLFWFMIVVTLAGSIVLGSLITSYLYKTNQAAAHNPAVLQPKIQKGVPEVGGDLVGKAVLLPEAECPINAPEPPTGTVTVSIMVDRNGQVNWARGSGGDWLMRGSATEAAMKSTFSPEKLRNRETEGTITYTFGP